MKRLVSVILVLTLMMVVAPAFASDALPELTFDSISIETEDAVTRNLALRTEYDDSVTLTWTSDKPEVISERGAVTRPLPGEEAVTVILTATASNGESKQFTVKVLPFSDAGEVLKKAASSLSFSSVSSENINAVTQNLSLPTDWNYGTYIVWRSNNENIIRVEGETGVVCRPTYGEGLSCIALSAYIGYENQSVSKTFLVKVMEESIGREISAPLVEVRDAFDRSFLSSQNILAIRDNLILPESANSEVSISFVSQTPDVISDSGEVFRSEERDQLAEFTVNFAYGYELTCLSYTMVVKAIGADEFEDRLAEDLDWLIASLESKHNLSRLAEDMTLPSAGPNLSAFSYSSSDTDILGNDGKIYRSDVSQNVTLTVVAGLNGLEETRTIDITVMPGNSYEQSGNTSGGSGTSGGSNGSGSGRGDSGLGGTVVEYGSGNVSISMDFDVTPKLFSDLPNDHWAYKAIKSLKDKGIVSGDAEGTFRPDDRLTREELVKMVVLAAGIPLDGAAASFSDVSAAHWSYPYVAAGFTNGVINGRDDGSFGLGASVIRQDAAVIIYNTMKHMGVSFDGASANFSDFDDVADYAKTAVSEMHGKGLINGKGDNMFMPLDYLTRAEAATMIWRMLS